MTSAVVFAYHNVGVRCLSVLLAHDIDVRLVVTHTDNPAENIWFGSVAQLASGYRIPVIMPDDPNVQAVVDQVRALQPDYLFSFYYRNMLKTDLLRVAAKGALNMHGSLLPKYRGRVPVNWAVINGETSTGATLHYMVEKPDAGDIVAQDAIPILPDDTAFEVFNRLTDCAAAVLDSALPALKAGNAPRTPQNLAAGSYFSGRKPEDGRIDWQRTAQDLHNLVRGVAPPYPGAFTEIDTSTLKILRTRLEPDLIAHDGRTGVHVREDACFGVCADGSVVRIIDMELEGRPLSALEFAAKYPARVISLETRSK